MIKKFFENQFIRFLLVGGINMLFGYSIFALLIFLKFHYVLASFLSTFIGILFNFKTTGKIVFKNTNNNLLWKFFGVYGIVYFCNIGMLKFFSTFEITNYISGAILVLPMAILAYFLNKIFVFKNKAIKAQI